MSFSAKIIAFAFSYNLGVPFLSKNSLFAYFAVFSFGTLDPGLFSWGGGGGGVQILAFILPKCGEICIF